MRHAGCADAIFQQQIPADDPGEEFAQGRVSVGVCRARHGHHRGEFSIAERGKGAGAAGDDKRKHGRRAGFVFGNHADDDEDAGANNRADAETGELQWAEHGAQAMSAAYLFQQ